MLIKNMFKWDMCNIIQFLLKHPISSVTKFPWFLAHLCELVWQFLSPASSGSSTRMCRYTQADVEMGLRLLILRSWSAHNADCSGVSSTIGAPRPESRNQTGNFQLPRGN